MRVVARGIGPPTEPLSAPEAEIAAALAHVRAFPPFMTAQSPYVLHVAHPPPVMDCYERLRPGDVASWRDAYDGQLRVVFMPALCAWLAREGVAAGTLERLRAQAGPN